MREIGSLASEELATRLVSYLQTQSIPASADAEGDVWTIWVQNDDDRERSRQILAQFQLTPDAPIYKEALAQAKKLRQAQARQQQALRRQHVDITRRWSGAWWHSHPITQLLTILCIVAVVFGTDWQARETGWMGLPATCNADGSRLRNALFMQPPLVITVGGESVAMFSDAGLKDLLRSGQVWRFVTPVFLHFGVMHILFNLMWLRNLGSAIEYVRGSRRFLLLFLILAVVSNTVQFLWSGPAFGGMSGVVFGLIGYVWMKGRTQPWLGLGLQPDQIVYSILWLLLCMGGVLGPIANGAHLGGFITGILIGSRQALLSRFRRLQNSE